MKRLLLGFGAAALSGILALRLVQGVPVGTGETAASPDGRYQATVYDWSDETLWGAKRSWYSYDVRTVPDGRVVERFTSDRLSSPPFGSRSGHRVIAWAEDSASVRIVFTHVEIAIRVVR